MNGTTTLVVFVTRRFATALPLATAAAAAAAAAASGRSAHARPCRRHQWLPAAANLHREASSAAAPSPADRMTLSDWPKCANPTPYDVLGHARAAPYTKDQFRRLVKLYHPDVHSTSSGITPTTRLERYHLVVKAHDILSDPAKRRAYDACGAHWGAPKRPLTDNERYKAWREGPYASCANNANWEDWEKWYEDQASGGPGKKEGYYMSNGAFVALVVATVSVLAVMQTAQADSRHRDLARRLRKEQEKLGASLSNSKEELQGLGRDERIERFLRHRENMAYGFGSVKYDERVRGGPSHGK